MSIKKNSYYTVGMALAAAILMTAGSASAANTSGRVADDGTVKGANDLIAENESHHEVEIHHINHLGVEDNGGRRNQVVSWNTTKPSVSRIFFVEGKGSLDKVAFGDVLDGRARLPKGVRLLNEISDDLTEVTEDKLKTEHSMSFDKIKKGKTVKFVIVSQRPDGTERSISQVMSFKAPK